MPEKYWESTVSAKETGNKWKENIKKFPKLDHLTPKEKQKEKWPKLSPEEIKTIEQLQTKIMDLFREGEKIDFLKMVTWQLAEKKLEADFNAGDTFNNTNDAWATFDAFFQAGVKQDQSDQLEVNVKWSIVAVSYTHLTLPTIYSV